MAGHNDKHHHETGVVTGKMIVQDLLNVCPQAEAVFKKHLGEKVFCVPAMKTEAIEFVAAMNDYHEYILVAELNEICKIAPEKVGHF